MKSFRLPALFIVFFIAFLVMAWMDAHPRYPLLVRGNFEPGEAERVIRIIEARTDISPTRREMLANAPTYWQMHGFADAVACVMDAVNPFTTLNPKVTFIAKLSRARNDPKDGYLYNVNFSRHCLGFSGFQNPLPPMESGSGITNALPAQR